MPREPEKHVNRDPQAPLSQMSSHIGSIPIHSANQRDRDPRSARAEPLSKPAYPFAAAMCCGLNDPSRRTSSDAQVSVGQHHVIALSEREHQLRPSVADARFSLVLHSPTTTSSSSSTTSSSSPTTSTSTPTTITTTTATNPTRSGTSSTGSGSGGAGLGGAGGANGRGVLAAATGNDCGT
jgi:hypothetical protein